MHAANNGELYFLYILHADLIKAPNFKQSTCLSKGKYVVFLLLLYWIKNSRANFGYTARFTPIAKD